MCDCDIAQVASIVDDLETFNKNKILTNEHSGSRTEVEQEVDTSKVFPMLKNWRHIYSVWLICRSMSNEENCLAGICEITQRTKIIFESK